jgi:hypothetical protein
MQCLQIDGLVVVCGKDLMQVQIKILKEWMKARKINPNDVFQVPIEFWK